VNGLFLGVINPFYISLILGVLDVRILSIGSFIGSALPFFAGLLLEHQIWYERFYRLLPIIIGIEVALTIAAIVVSMASVPVYYLFGMAIFGLLDTSIIYLLQRLKEKRYAGHRAVFERRFAMFDALGYLAGSLLVFFGVIVLTTIWQVLAVGVAHSIGVYILYLIPYWKAKKIREA
jgi:uncharacterized membrane protein